MTQKQEWLLERMLLDEVPLGSEGAARELEATPGARERLAELRQENEEILRAHPADRIAAAIDKRAAAALAPKRRQAWVWAIPAVAAAAAVFLFAILETDNPTVSGGEEIEVTRLKGARPALTIHRKTASGSEELRDGDSAAAGDLIQMSYVANGARHGVILSIDGNGTVTQHFPVHDSTDTRLAKRDSLANSYELDDAPHFERFVLVAGHEAIDIDAVLEGAEALAASEDRDTAILELPAPLEQEWMTLVKEETR